MPTTTNMPGEKNVRGSVGYSNAASVGKWSLREKWTNELTRLSGLRRTATQTGYLSATPIRESKPFWRVNQLASTPPFERSSSAKGV